jgi:hypothetical protein
MRLPVLSYSLFLALLSVVGLLHDRRGTGSAPCRQSHDAALSL